MRTYEESERASHSDTEITLGMRSILGIFFGLALICGVFFGFGYSLGRGNATKAFLNAPSAAQTAAQYPTDAAPLVKTVVEQSPDAASPQPKPLAGAPLPPPSLDASTSAAPAAPPQVAKASYSAPAPQNAVPVSYPAQPSAARPQAAPAQAVAAQPIMVQIAAVSRREDADALVSALKKLGYSASVHSDPPDSLLHVQVGPFATRDAAKAMRAKLLNDGYNAILK